MTTYSNHQQRLLDQGASFDRVLEARRPSIVGGPRTAVQFIGGKIGEVDGPVSATIQGHYTRAGLVGWLEVLGYRVVRLIDVKESE